MKETRPGVWAFRVSLGTDPMTGHRIQQRVTVLGSRSDAVRRFQEIEADKLARAHPSSAITLRDLRRHWDESTRQQGRRRRTTAAMEDSAFRRYIDPLLGDLPLHRLSAESITRAYDHLSGQLSQASIRRLHQQLSSILRWAVKRGYVGRAETERVDLPKRRKSVPTAPEFDDVLALLKSAQDDEDLWLMIRLTASLALRRGELAGLQFGDINFEKETITISKSVIAFKGEQPSVTETKTGDAGVAHLPSDPVLFQELKLRRTRYRSIALELGIPLDEIFIFSGDQPGHPRRPDFFSRRFSLHIRRNPRFGHITLKSLRKFTGTELAGEGVDLITSKTALRHTDASTTAEYYTAPRERNIRQAMVGLGVRLGGRY